MLYLTTGEKIFAAIIVLFSLIQTTNMISTKSSYGYHLHPLSYGYHLYPLTPRETMPGFFKKGLDEESDKFLFN